MRLHLPASRIASGVEEFKEFEGFEGFEEFEEFEEFEGFEAFKAFARVGRRGGATALPLRLAATRVRDDCSLRSWCSGVRGETVRSRGVATSDASPRLLPAATISTTPD